MVLPYVDIGRGARLKNVVIDRGVQIPEGLVVGEDPELDAKRFRRTEQGHLPDHPADDRPAGTPDARCASSRSRRRSSRWSRPAASPTSPARCRVRSAPLGVELRTLVPGYPAVLAGLEADGGRRSSSPSCWAAPVRLLSGRAAGLDLLVLDAPHLYARPGNPYLGPDGRDWPDNRRRFAAARAGRGRDRPRPLARLAARRRPRATTGRRASPRPISPSPASRGRRPCSPSTIWPSRACSRLPASRARPAAARRFAIEGFEYWGRVGFLKAGLYYADRITTVSPTYAQEIQTEAEGMGLDGLLRTRAPDLVGIVNGIDDAVWDPATDRNLAAPLRREPT